MHLWLHEPKPERLPGILAELQAASLKPVLIDDHFFENGAKAFVRHSEWMHPLLLAASSETLDRIRSIRKAGGRNPIIVYRDLKSAERAIQALEAGADHVAITPLRGEELRARFSAILRRTHGHSASKLELGSMMVFFCDADPVVSGQVIALRPMERQVLHRLALEVGHPVSRSQIYETIYGLAEKKPFANVIDRHLCNIRRKIGVIDPDAANMLRTFPGRGYALAPAEMGKICREPVT